MEPSPFLQFTRHQPAPTLAPTYPPGVLEVETVRRKTYLVWGLTCGACLAQLIERVRSLAGVRSVGVDLVKGGGSRLTLVAVATPRRQLVRAAVEGVGFSLSPPPARSLGSVEVER